jgi:hypothetical protein
MESPAFCGERSRTKGGAFYLDNKSECKIQYFYLSPFETVS